MSIQEMCLNKKQKKLLENTEREAREWLQTSSRYLFEEDVEYELRLLGQYNIIEKNAGYPESLKLMWYWREIADEIIEDWREQGKD